MKIVGNGIYLAYLAYLLNEANIYITTGQPIHEYIWRPLGFLLATGVVVAVIFVWVGPPPQGITPRTDRATVIGAILLLWTMVAFGLTGLM